MTTEQMVESLTQRGMVFKDLDQAISILNRVNYYHLSGYWHTQLDLGENSSKFKLGTDFEQVLKVFEFDKVLRKLLWPAIEELELFLRRSTASVLALKYGPFAHLKLEIFSSRSKWSREYRGILFNYENSKESFAKHYQEKYPLLPTPPIWVIVELVSFNAIVEIINNLKNRSDRNEISRLLGLDETVLIGILKQINQIRNICAHHARLWNRRLSSPMAIPENIDPLFSEQLNKSLEVNRKVFNIIIMLAHLQNQISNDSTLLHNFRDLLERSDPSLLFEMGAGPKSYENLLKFGNP